LGERDSRKHTPPKSTRKLTESRKKMGRVLIEPVTSRTCDQGGTGLGGTGPAKGGGVDCCPGPNIIKTERGAHTYLRGRRVRRTKGWEGGVLGGE